MAVSNDVLRRRGVTDDRLVALTFDDGPDPRYTPRILNILRRERVKATFFVVGVNARAHPELVRRAYLAGNTIGNHTWDHPELELLPVAKMRSELISTAQEIQFLTGKKPAFFRPPHGIITPAVDEVAQSLGYKTVLWSNAIVEHYPSLIESNLLTILIRPGAIVLAHDGRLNHEQSLRDLPLLIHGLKRRGFKFVTLDKMPLP